MGLRERKNALLTVLKAKALAHRLTPEQVDTFDRMYRSARTFGEQDEVTRALELQVNGWKTGTDAYSRIPQAANDLDELGEPDDDDPPSLKAALARSRVVSRR